jgi:hypothetical protein
VHKRYAALLVLDGSDEDHSGGRTTGPQVR